MLRGPREDHKSEEKSKEVKGCGQKCRYILGTYTQPSDGSPCSGQVSGEGPEGSGI